MKNLIGKKFLRAFVCAAAVAALPSIVSAQIGFSVSDFNGQAPQRLYRFDVNSGEAEDLGVIQTTAEQEGLFSVGSILLGYSEYDPALASEDERDPGTRILPFPGQANAPNLFGSAPNSNRRVCAAGALGRFGTESGAGYNPVDGFVYVVNSNDRAADGVVGSRFIRFKPGCTGFQQIGADSSTYVDGLAVDPNGNVYVSDFRLQDRIYRLNTATGALTPVGSLGAPFNLDSGLSWDFENNRLLALTEDGRIYQINLAAGATLGNATFLAQINIGGTPVQGDLEGFDIPVQDPIP